MHLDSKKLAFSARLKELMDERDLNQVQVAERINVAQSQVSNWRGGKTIPQPRIAQALAEQLGVNLEWLLEGQGPKTPGDKSRVILSTAKQIADLARDKGLPPDHVQMIFEISEQVVRKGGGAVTNNEWKQRAMLAEERADAAEKKLTLLKKNLSKVVEEL